MAIAIGPAELCVVFRHEHRPVAGTAGLPHRFGGDSQIHRAGQVVPFDSLVTEVWPTAPGSDRGAHASGVQRARRVAVAVLARAEDVLILLKEEPFLREEGLVGGEVHHHVVGFDLPEIGIDSSAQKEGRRRSPEHVHAGIRGPGSPHKIVANCGVGEYADLLARRDPGQSQRLEQGDELRLGIRQRRPRPNFVEMRHEAGDLDGDAALAVAGRHVHHGPGQEHLHGPAIVRPLGAGIPGPVPVAREAPLRKEGAVH